MATAEAAEPPTGIADARRAWRFAASEDGARWAFWAAFAGSLVVLYVAGRHQWFIRDDWALILTRRRVLHDTGVANWLFYSQDGHWLTVPTLVFRVLTAVFGLGSYWPFLLTAMLPHLATVLVVRLLCRRHDVSEWTTTLLCTVLLVLGSGWENILFAVQISYNLSLLGFLVQLLLTDHDGPIDWRDWLGLAAAFVGLLSSGFGPFFILGIAVFLVLRGRWLAAAVAAVPQLVAYGWWYLAYARDAPTDVAAGGKSQVAAFTARALVATFTSVVGFATLAGVALLATLAVTCWRPAGRIQAVLVALAVTTVLMFAGIGVQRVGLGLQTAEASRYVYMGAMLLAPVFAVAVDRLALVAPPALHAGRIILAASALLNIGQLLSFGSDWARRSTCDELALSLVAGAPERTASLDPQYQPLAFSLDVRIVDLPYLVEESAITPRSPANQAEQVLLDAAVDPTRQACPAPV
ncbi:MAG: hypothetical protein QM733_13855 [Ilumatobacteraceae bacterium]